jgi:hypothetical protein
MEVQHYEKTSSDIFKRYMELWQREKQQASGWPSGCDTEEQKQAYIVEYLENEGIQLDWDSIEKNPGKRSLTKLFLNSFWGKLAQRPNLTQTQVCHNSLEIFRIANDEKLEITGVLQMTDTRWMVSYVHREDETADPGISNIGIAAFVTSYARTHLYKFLDQVLRNGEDRLLYFDTDSLVFVEKPGDAPIELGRFFGDLTDELADYGPGAEITRFVSNGPKNYGYEVRIANGERKVVRKLKGITLNATVETQLSLDKMEELGQSLRNGNENASIKVPQTVFRADKRTQQVFVNEVPKMYRAVSKKRRIIGNKTLPFGYVDK